VSTFPRPHLSVAEATYPGFPAEATYPAFPAGGAAPAGDESWREDALCAETDPEAFFPEKGGSTREAKKICTGCERCPTTSASASGAACPSGSAAGCARRAGCRSAPDLGQGVRARRGSQTARPTRARASGMCSAVRPWLS
jgi:hypothetical protein